MGLPRANFRPFLIALKRSGFLVTSDAQCDHERICVLEKDLPDRTLNLQLWGDGGHRVSHVVQGSENTYPTDFSDLPSMADAIEHESTRRDNYKLNSATWKKGDVLRGEGAIWIVGEPPEHLPRNILVDRLRRFGDSSIGLTLGHCYPPEHDLWRRFELIAYGDALTVPAPST